MKKINPALKWWVSPYLPQEHLKVVNGLSDYLFKFIFHPIKRRVAKYYLSFLRRAFGLKVIGITGSTGKTTTKEMIASILKQEGKTVASFANIDPVYNIPSTILSCTPSTKYLVLEMGVEYPGEMDFYMWLATPDIGVITNIYPTHTEFFRNVGGVFREKSKLVRTLKKNNIAVLNSQDKLLSRLKNNINSRIVWFGDGTAVMSSQEALASNFKTKFLLTLDNDSQKRVEIKLPTLGKHFILNALAASAVAHSLGIGIKKIQKGLQNYETPPHRMKMIKHVSGALIIDDSYNNSPAAAHEALLTLSYLPGEKIIVFGDMLELGRWEEKYHSDLGKDIALLRPNLLICVGQASRVTAQSAAKILGKEKVLYFPVWQNVIKPLSKYLKKGNVVLIKGSRKISLDSLAARLS